MSDLKQLRLAYHPKIPKSLNDPVNLKAYVENGLICFKKGNEKKRALRVAVLFSGGPAAGGHTVVAGLFDALEQIDKDSVLIGLLNGPQGLVTGESKILTKELVDSYRNLGGFDMIGSSRTKIETPSQFEAALNTVRRERLDGLVIIGGDDSNTNAAHLATYFSENNSTCGVVGVPKTIDGDLKNEQIELSFGFDTATKVYSEAIGSLCTDAESQKKYTFFVKLMGRSASHIALECALQTHPNLCLIGEEIAAKGLTFGQVVKEIADLIEKRHKAGKNYGVILIPEGVIEFIPNSVLSGELDPHGNVQVSKIESERLFIEEVSKVLERRGVSSFNPQPLFLGYEGRSCFPSNFDCDYTYALGKVAACLINNRQTGVIAIVKHLKESRDKWIPMGAKLAPMLGLEKRKGKELLVIKKALVDLKSEVFLTFARERGAWELGDEYLSPGGIQFFGPEALTEKITKTLELS